MLNQQVTKFKVVLVNEGNLINNPVHFYFRRIVLCYLQHGLIPSSNVIGSLGKQPTPYQTSSIINFAPLFTMEICFY